MASGFSTPLQKLTQRTVAGAKSLKRRAKRRFDLFEPLQLVVFRGYGTPGRVSVSGRVVEDEGLGELDADPGRWDSFRITLKRLRSDDIPDAKLEVRLGKVAVETRTDNEGYFDVSLTPEAPLEPGWHEVSVRVVESLAGGEGTEATGEVLVPPEEAEFGVISDLDDTVIYTRATNRLRMVRIVLFQNARTRKPFPGVAAFYRALKLGPDGRGANPIFYVSRSPWNLYDLFERFFELNDIPRGPLFLRDLYLLEAPSKVLGADQDKLSRIRKLLNLYPRLKFVLVGDSGQRDPEIYQQIVGEFPQRIRAIYIRDVGSKRRSKEVHRMADAVREHDVPMLLTSSTAEAAAHALELGLIAPPQKHEVEEKKEAEEAEA